MRYQSPTQSGNSQELQMTPMIDVIFQLLIFFICTSSFQLPEKLFATPIQAMTGNQPSESTQTFELPEKIQDFEEIVILLHFEKSAWWEVYGNQITDFRQLETMFKTLAEDCPEVPLILDVDPNVPVENVIQLYAAGKRNGFQKIQFAVDGGGNHS